MRPEAAASRVEAAKPVAPTTATKARPSALSARSLCWIESFIGVAFSGERGRSEAVGSAEAPREGGGLLRQADVDRGVDLEIGRQPARDAGVEGDDVAAVAPGGDLLRGHFDEGV